MSYVLRERDLFLNYCQNIEDSIDLIQKELNKQNPIDSNNIIRIVKQISNITFSSNSILILSPEALACKNLVDLFNKVLLRMILIESKVSKKSMFLTFCYINK